MSWRYHLCALTTGEPRARERGPNGLGVLDKALVSRISPRGNMTTAKNSRLKAKLVLLLLSVMTIGAVTPLAMVQAQTEIVTATPGYINLGMTTSIAVTGPAAGSYNVEVSEPGGASATLPYTFTSAGQVVTNVFGSSTAGFSTVVKQVGTYNIFVLQGTTVLGSTSFYATNKLIITMDMVTGGTCGYILSDARGYKFIPRFYAAYASTGALINVNTTGAKITFTGPNGALTAASWDSGAVLYRGLVQPAWNYTYIGPWNPKVNAQDGFGNYGNFTYAGSPFEITAASLSTTIQLTDSKTNAPVASIYPGESVTISANVQYPTNAETVSGFAQGLDSVQRGGVVTATLGYGLWNTTTGAFGGGAKNPGANIGTVTLTNTNGINGTWTGTYTFPSTLPALPTGTSFAVAVTSSDKANPPNTGLQVNNLGLTTAPSSAGQTVTATASGSTSTVTQTVSISGTQTITPSTSTVTSTVTSASTSVSTSMSTTTATVSSVTSSIPSIAYAGMVALLVVGVAIGLIVRMPRGTKPT